jgi:hypothetical protein
MDLLQQSIYRRIAAVDSFLTMFRTTPSQFVLMLSWDKDMPASSDISLRLSNKSAGAIYGK